MLKLRTKVRTVRTVDTPSLYLTIGQAMKEAREAAGMSQEQVGLALGMTRANMSNLESGRSAILLPHVYNLAMLLDLPIHRLLPKL